MKTVPSRIVLRSDLSELPRAHAEVKAWLDERGAGRNLRFDADLVVEEIVTNLVKYAWPRGGEHRIALSVDEDDGGHLVLQFEDDGAPFDLRTAPEPALDQPIEKREPGRLGLHLVKSVAASIDYRSENGTNQLTIRLKTPLDKTR
jgi:anti-sigma regulatory factor (Ser/Thr protein kinase)